MTMSVWVREESSLKHLIVRWLNAWDNMSRCKGNLLSLSEVVVWVLVKNQLTNWNEWVVSMRDYFSDIKNVKFIVFTSLFRDQLNVPCP